MPELATAGQKRAGLGGPGPPLGRFERFADVDRLADDLAVSNLEEVDAVVRVTALVLDGQLDGPEVVGSSDALDGVGHGPGIAAAPLPDVRHAFESLPRLRELED